MSIEQYFKYSEWKGIIPPFTDRQNELFINYDKKPFYPLREDVFNAFEAPPSDVKVVIIGQDPYHNTFKSDEVYRPRATGFAFSVPEGCPLPPSLQNIFKLLSISRNSGDLKNWVEQGVFLFNTSLTVKPGEANSHEKIWNAWTDQVIKNLSEKSKKPIVFLLWGRKAEDKKHLINKRHKIIVTSHPSPFSAHRGFLTSNCFEKANQELEKLGSKKIKWV